MKIVEGRNYTIMRGNSITFDGTTQVEVARGSLGVRRAISRLDRQLTKEERDAGWYHYVGKSTREPIYPRPAKKRGLKPDAGGKR